ncbi:MAG: UDP-N-acetylmuramate--L-alanine ligase [Fidelibacterota bacterium]
MKYRSVNHIHFVGIGGIGMSGIAELLINLGFSVTGSDLADSAIIQHLRSCGATIHRGHSSDNIGDCEVLVYSSAVKRDNPELIAAEQRGIPIIRRAEMLGELIAVKETSIGVAGTHGKTSTSSMLGAVLFEANMDPTLVIGGLVKKLDTNSVLGSGDIIVVEADEYDRSFLALNPTMSIITNIELEHTDIYQDLEDIQKAFIQYGNSSPFYGRVVACIDSPGVQSILAALKRPITTYGFSQQADFKAKDLEFNEYSSSFQVISPEKALGEISLHVPGTHNVLNALSVVALTTEMGIPFPTIQKGLSAYGGVRRRFEMKGLVHDIMVIDDYAHHPTEVKATLKAARNGWDRRIITVFQPHLYSRTRDFHTEFASAFMDSDIFIVTDIYPAREEPIPGVSGKLVADAGRRSGHRNAHFIPDFAGVQDLLDDILKEGDMVITIGAGSIWRFSEQLVQHLQETYDA